MQEISETQLAASLAANRPPRANVVANWGGAGWVNETSRIDEIHVTLEASDAMQGVSALGKAIADTVEIKFKNVDKRFSPWYSSSPLYSYLADGAWDGTPISVQLGYQKADTTAEYVYVLNGIIADLQPDVGRQSIKIKCLDNFGRFADYRTKTALFENIGITDFAEQLRLTLPAAIRPSQVTAGFDPSCHSLRFAWCDDESLVEELSKLAEAEGGRVYFDGNGKMMFENAMHLAAHPHSSSVATFTVDSFASLQAEYHWRDKARRIQVFYTEPLLCRTEAIWSLPEARALPANATTIIRAQFNTAAKNVITPSASSDYFVRSHAGLDKTSDVNITMTTWAQQAVLEVENTLAYEIVLDRMQLRGQPVKFTDEESVSLVVDSAGAVKREDVDSITLGQAGKKPFEVKGNWFIQSPEHALSLGYLYAYRLRKPRMKLHLTNLRGMPWLEPGDRVTVTERGSTSMLDFYIHTIDLYLRGALTMDLTLLGATGMFASDTYFRLTEADELAGGRVFFL